MHILNGGIDLKRLMILTLILIGMIVLSGCVSYTRETYEIPVSEGRWQEPGYMYPAQYDRALYPDFPTEFSSNGEMIYYTGFNETGQQIPIRGGLHWLYVHGGSCVNCHGVNGKGSVPIMMSAAIPSDITYDSLTSEDKHEGEHDPYTDETIKIAIRDGIDPSGEEFDYAMPKWDMSDSDLDDLIEYLKTL